MFANSLNKRLNGVSLERVLENAQEQESDSSHEEIHERLFLVEKILDKKKFEGMYKYKVKWEGFSSNECTWEPYDNLTNVSALVEDFEKKRIEKEGSKKSSKKASAIKDLGERKIERGIQNKTFKRLKRLETDFGNCTDLVEVIESDDNSQKVVPPRKGHFIKGDKAKCIKSVMKKDNKVIFKIEWEQDKNEERIMDSKMDSDEVRKYDKDLIIDYYQSHLRVAKVDSQTLSETNRIQTVEDDDISERESLESDMSKESKYSGNFGKRLSDWLIKKGERIREYSFKRSKESRLPMQKEKTKSREARKSKRMLHVEDKHPSEEDSII